MDFKRYQEAAAATDRMGDDEKQARVIALLGLAGESSELLSAYKKYLRDADDTQLFPERISEELGDSLWYLASTASRFGLDLDAIAEANLAKARERFRHATTSTVTFFDDAYPENERIPRKFVVEFRPVERNGQKLVELYRGDVKLGSPLRDNSYAEDGYRFHDVFHLSYAAVLAWSPVTRFFFKAKRKSAALVDEVEDGGRAIAVEEGISAYVFAEAADRRYFADAPKVEYSVLRAVRRMVKGLEVSVRTEKDWEQAILAGYHVFRTLNERKGGHVSIDLSSRSISYVA